jgi:hypothetical protein
LYSSSNVIRLIKSRSMKWASNVECMRAVKCVQNFKRKLETTWET